MTTIELDIEKLSAAITALGTLHDDIHDAVLNCRKQSPEPLPSLAEGRMVNLQTWLLDQKPELQTRRDWAILLKNGETKGTVKVDIPADTLEEIEKALGREIADGLDDLDVNAEPGTGTELVDIINQYSGNAIVTAAMYGELGPKRSAEILRMVHLVKGQSKSYPEEYNDLYDGLLDSMTSASQLLDRDFSEDLTHWLMPADAVSDDDGVDLLESQTALSGPRVLADLLDGGQLGSDFLKGMADEIERGEKQMGDKSPTVWNNVAGDDVGDLLFKQMSGDPTSTLDWFEEGGRDREKYWFDQRDFSSTGYDGISEAVDSIVTDPGLVTTRAHDTSALATSFFDLVANSPGFDDAKPAADSLSHIMAFYMPSVVKGVRVRGDEELPLPDESLALPPWDDLGVAPLFQHDDLERIAAVAMSTDDGTITVAEGYSQLTSQRLSALADDGTIDQGTLSTILTDDAGLRGFLDRAAADSDIRDGASADEKKRNFAHIVSEVAGELPIPGAEKLGDKGGDLLKSGYEYTVNHLIDRGEEAANDRWATSEEEARNNAVSTAESGYHEAKYSIYRALVESGIVQQNQVIDGTVSGNGSAIVPYDELTNPRSYSDNIDALLNHLNLDANTVTNEYFSQYVDPLAGVRPTGGN